MLKEACYWVIDYFYAICKQGESLILKKQPYRYLHSSRRGQNPIILIPGVYEKWNFLRAIADQLSAEGHPIYSVGALGYNKESISDSAELIRKLIDENKLENVVLVAHSKGGLIGKYLLSFYDKDARIKKLIAIATPFGGSGIVKFVPHELLHLSPSDATIKLLQEHEEANHKVVSISGIFDNHVWPVSSCHLLGAKNIIVQTHGHHRILADEKVKLIVATEAKE